MYNVHYLTSILDKRVDFPSISVKLPLKSVGTPQSTAALNDTNSLNSHKNSFQNPSTTMEGLYMCVKSMITFKR